uniref:Cytochrome b561 domain-containing protein n=1 Tax=Wuchereria bancrofti TaxID=6293 RepID=A0AAF5Q005_WUCBA
MYTTISSVIVLVIAFFTVCSSQFILSECLKNKACIFISANCEEKGDCEKIISYALEPDDWVVVELFYNTTHPDTNYAAIGFSKDTQMGDEGVTHCGLGEMNQAGVFLSQNDGKRNIPLNLTAEISNAAKYVELLEASHTSGSIYCKFRQKVAPDETAQKARVPDLNRTYYLLLAYGKTNKYEELDIHSLDERSKDFPLFISTPVNVAAWERAPLAPVKPRTNRKLVILHGILMLVGWMWLIPSAIAAARYLREYWPETRPFGLKIWFHIHRTTNYLAIILIIIGVLSVFVGKEWRWTGPAVSKTIQRNLSAGAIHSIIGAITVGVMLIQPVGALLRCDEGSKSRIVFNWSHRIFGFLSFLLEISIILSVIFFRLWVARWAAIVLYVLYVILIALLFFLIKKTNPLKGQQNISVTYAGRHYHQEQIVITEAKYDNKTNRLTVLIILVFTALSALITIIMMVLMLASM